MKKKWLAVVGLALVTSAFAGNDKGNGGDICEKRFLEVRNDIRDWIEKDGAKLLVLPSDVNSSDYSSEMLRQIKNASVSCTNEKVVVYGAEKTCSNSISNGKSTILCNADRFKSISDSDQYVLVHHEYAGLSGFEINDGKPESNYAISGQIKGAVLDSIRPTITKTSMSGHVFTKVSHLPKLGESWRDESGLIWGDVYFETYNLSAQDPDKKGRFDKGLTYRESVSYCKSIGARLPTWNEFTRLARFLGAGSPTGYVAEILPALNHVYFTSTPWMQKSGSLPNNLNGWTTVAAFDALDGTLDYKFSSGGNNAHFRCVVQDESIPADNSVEDDSIIRDPHQLRSEGFPTTSKPTPPTVYQCSCESISNFESTDSTFIPIRSGGIKSDAASCLQVAEQNWENECLFYTNKARKAGWSPNAQSCEAKQSKQCRVSKTYD